MTLDQFLILCTVLFAALGLGALALAAVLSPEVQR